MSEGENKVSQTFSTHPHSDPHRSPITLGMLVQYLWDKEQDVDLIPYSSFLLKTHPKYMMAEYYHFIVLKDSVKNEFEYKENRASEG